MWKIYQWKRTFCVKAVIVWGRKKLPCCIKHDFSRILCSRNCFNILVPVIYIRSSGSTIDTVYFQYNGFFFTLIGRPITWNGQWLIFRVGSVEKSHRYSQARAYTFGRLILLCEVPPQNQLRFDSWLFFALQKNFVGYDKNYREPIKCCIHRDNFSVESKYKTNEVIKEKQLNLKYDINLKCDKRHLFSSVFWK